MTQPANPQSLVCCWLGLCFSLLLVHRLRRPLPRRMAAAFPGQRSSGRTRARARRGFIPLLLVVVGPSGSASSRLRQRRQPKLAHQCSQRQDGGGCLLHDVEASFRDVFPTCLLQLKKNRTDAEQNKVRIEESIHLNDAQISFVADLSRVKAAWYGRERLLEANGDKI